MLGYAFAEVRPQFDRDKDKREMNVTFGINEAPRVYVEKININGNTLTRDSVIRREFRLAEGDAFNSFKVKRTRDRIQGLGFFQEKFEIEQKPGSAPDKVILEANVQEKPTGELQVSAGFSSLERFILSLSIRAAQLPRPRPGTARLGQYLVLFEIGRAGLYRAVSVRPQPGAGRRPVPPRLQLVPLRPATGTNNRDTTYQQVSTGMQARVGFPITEFWAASVRYGLSQDKIELDNIYNDPITGQCSPLLAGRYLCDSIGDRTTSSVGYSIIYDNLNNRLRPERRAAVHLQPGFRRRRRWRPVSALARQLRPLLGAVRLGLRPQPRWRGRLYLRLWQATAGRARTRSASTTASSSASPSCAASASAASAPRVTRRLLDAMGNVSTDKNSKTDDAIGGRAYYKARAEIQIPLGSAGAELGLRPSIFADMGAVFGVKKPNLICQQPPAGVPQIADPSCCRQHRPVRRASANSIKVIRLARVSRSGPACRGIRRSGRSASTSPRPGQVAGRQYQSFPIQRRDSILMKTMLKTVALAATMLAGGIAAPAAAQALPPAIIVVVDMDQVFATSAAGKQAAAELKTRFDGHPGPRPGAAHPVWCRGAGARQEPAGSRCDAGNHQCVARPRSRITRPASRSDQAELAKRDQDFQASRQSVARQIQDAATPIITTVMKERGASIALTEGATIAHSQAIDVTTDVVARLDKALPRVSTAVPAAPAK